MRKFTLLFILGLLSLVSAFAQWPASGGPDAYGYTFETFNNTDSRYQWVDITTKGREVFGLTDDNFVGPFDMGIEFDYYWIRRDEVWIGSNGYISFGRGFNISSTANGFPVTPTPDNNNELVAPFMCDLSFDGPGNTGRCFTWTNNVDSFIVAFHDVPFWTNNTAGYDGSNTFQVIFNAADSTIKFQYLTQNGSWNSSYDQVPNPMVTGIENVTGNLGLLISNTIKPTPQSGAIWYAPSTALIDIDDVAPVSIQNPNTEGFFIPVPGSNLLNAVVGNVGNTNITSQIDLRLQATDTLGQTFYNLTQSLDSLPRGFSQQVDFLVPFNPPLPTAGQPYTPYILTASTSNSQDINPTNNVRTIEAIAVDTSGGQATLGYASGDPFNIDGVISWTGGAGNSGAGIFIEPFGYPVTVDTIEIRVDPFIGWTPDPVAFALDIYGFNPFGSGPGPLLYTDTVTPGDLIPAGAWYKVAIPPADRPTITEDGFYLGWIQLDDSLVLRTETAAPISRRTYEILNGTWADYRSESDEDIWLRAICDVSSAVICKLAVTGQVVAADTNSNATGMAAAVVDSTSGSAPFTFLWDDPSNQTTQVASGLSAGVYHCVITDDNGCKDNITVTVPGVINTTGITGDLMDLEVFEIYPNPTDGIFTLNLQLDQPQEMSIRVFDLQGRKVHVGFARGNQFTETIDLSQQTPGVYMVQVTTPRGQATSKVVVE